MPSTSSLHSDVGLSDGGIVSDLVVLRLFVLGSSSWMTIVAVIAIDNWFKVKANYINERLA